MSLQRTLAIIKTDARHDVEKIVAMVTQNGFYVSQREEVHIKMDHVEAMYPGLTPSEKDALLKHMGGPSIALALNKLDAVNSWIELMGPADPSVARTEKPYSIRALFGTDVNTNAVYGSDNHDAAERDIALFFPKIAPNSKEWVLDTIVPGLTEGLAELSLVRPDDPYLWLAKWLHKHRPPKERQTVYAEPVLEGNCMKSDRFEGIGKLKDSNLSGITANGLSVDNDIGYWNFRKSLGTAPVYGIGQCHKEGIKHCLKFIASQSGYDKIVCCNMREEPVAFVDGLPIAPREHGHLNDNVEHLGGIDGHELTIMEVRLKQDLEALGGKLGVYHQKADMTNHEKVHELKDGSVQTLSEIYVEFREKEAIQCEYIRIPITDETAPDEKAFDALVGVMKQNLTLHPAFVMNCQMGRGRTTTAMVCMTLFWQIKSRVEVTKIEPVDPENPKLERGEFRTVLDLLRLLPNGMLVKKHVDTAIDECGAFHNLRTSIYDAKKDGEKAEAAGGGSEGRDAPFWFNRALNYLKRYYYVLMFGAYLMDHVHEGLTVTFREYLREKWQLKGPLCFIALE